MTQPRLAHLLEIVRILAGIIMEDEVRLSTDISESDDSLPFDNDATPFVSMSHGTTAVDATHQ